MHRPFLLTATLRTGVGLDLPYGLDLAGILAGRMRTIDRDYLVGATSRRHDAVLPHSMEEVPEDMGLPLAQCFTGHEWHWLASCAVPVGADPDPETRVFYKVVDTALMQSAALRPLPYHHPSKGSFRNLMVPAPVIVCEAVQWRGMGDPERVLDLVRGITNIGRRRNVGEGRVLRWAIEEAHPSKPSADWVHVDGARVLRPVPAECLDELGVPHSPVQYAIRPPSWNPERLLDLAGTQEAEDDWEEAW